MINAMRLKINTFRPVPAETAPLLRNVFQRLKARATELGNSKRREVTRPVSKGAGICARRHGQCYAQRGWCSRLAERPLRIARYQVQALVQSVQPWLERTRSLARLSEGLWERSPKQPTSTWATRSGNIAKSHPTRGRSKRTAGFGWQSFCFRLTAKGLRRRYFGRIEAMNTLPRKARRGAMV